MPIRVLVELNGTPIAEARAANISNLADVSDYDVIVTERGNQELRIDPLHVEGLIVGHKRRQSVWALVSEIAALAAQSRKS